MTKEVDCKNPPSHYYFFIRGLIRSQFHWHLFPHHFNDAALQVHSNSRAVFFDIPGNGQRFLEKTPFSISGMADDIEQQIVNYVESHKIDSASRIHLVGISMGGMIAAELAKKPTLNIASLHIINSSFANLSPFWHRMRIPAVLHLVQNIWQVDKRENAILQWTSNTPNSTQLAGKWIDEAKQHPLSLRNGFAQLWAASHYFVDKEVRQKRFIYCSDLDRLVKSDCSKKLASYWQAPLECEANAGHDLPLDNPTWLAQKIISNSQNQPSH